jgi:hypothetical protein
MTGEISIEWKVRQEGFGGRKRGLERNIVCVRALHVVRC